eukprot:CAMPEP_0184288216 /NCGR_PEP_ID=MMETSP1049-20130417/720_1 /TAXON_ID=77928 /ORGANISM="Proteomonas sulcata, Strain CCMP704" /LENGTH=41 /DNA_ID= /DNA_START= /DNA_END= /DNA_ORIENTATION=
MTASPETSRVRVDDGAADGDAAGSSQRDTGETAGSRDWVEV